MTKDADKTDDTGEKQTKPHLFKPGQSGNPQGRPKGSRNKLAEEFLTDLLASWRENGKTVLAAAAYEKPAEYARMVASLLPKDVNVTADHTVTHVGEPVSATADWIAGLLRERKDRPIKESKPH